MQKTFRHWAGLPEDDIKTLLTALIGRDFGPNPEQRVAEIRESRRNFANYFCDLANVTRDDTLIDLGSGCGFGTSRLAERAGRVHACDVSPAYLSFAERECVGLNNISFHLIEPRSLTCIADRSVDVVVSMSVFIHFNLYDIYWNFQELKRVVKPSGRVLIDIADSEALDLDRQSTNREHFLNHAHHYREDPSSIAGLMQWNSLAAVAQVAGHFGFDNVQRTEWGQMLFRRRAD